MASLLNIFHLNILGVSHTFFTHKIVIVSFGLKNIFWLVVQDFRSCTKTRERVSMKIPHSSLRAGVNKSVVMLKVDISYFLILDTPIMSRLLGTTDRPYRRRKGGGKK